MNISVIMHKNPEIKGQVNCIDKYHTHWKLAITTLTFLVVPEVYVLYNEINIGPKYKQQNKTYIPAWLGFYGRHTSEVLKTIPISLVKNIIILEKSVTVLEKYDRRLRNISSYVITIFDIRILVFREERLQLLASSRCRMMLENKKSWICYYAYSNNSACEVFTHWSRMTPYAIMDLDSSNNLLLNGTWTIANISLERSHGIHTWTLTNTQINKSNEFWYQYWNYCHIIWGQNVWQFRTTKQATHHVPPCARTPRLCWEMTENEYIYIAMNCLIALYSM